MTNKAFRTCLSLAFIVFACDRVTKELALYFEPRNVAVVPNFFSLTLVTNTGTIWGLGESCTQLLAWFGVSVAVLLCVFFRPFIQAHPIGSGLLLGGLCGNTFDRFRYGHVVDFLDFYIRSRHWPCFNVADIAITTTCLWLLFFGYRVKKGG